MTTEKLYALLGELACAFSTMEYAVDHLLARMVNTKNVVIGSLVSKDVSLSKRQQTIRLLCPWMMLRDPAIRDEINKAMDVVDSVRIARNGFIHGQWIIDQNTIKQGHALCLDMRWDIKKAKDQKTKKVSITAKRATSTKFTFTEIEDTTRKVRDVTTILFDLEKRLALLIITKADGEKK